MPKSPTLNYRKARYPWEKRGEKDPDWQCVYCGRYIRDRRAIRAQKEGPWKVHACMACDAILAMSRLDSLQGKQNRVTEILKITDPTTIPENHRVYVSREGLEIIDWRTGFVKPAETEFQVDVRDAVGIRLDEPVKSLWYSVYEDGNHV